VYHLKAHARTVAAFLLREMATRYSRTSGGYLWAILEPVGYIAIMSFVAGGVARTPALGDNFLLFFATGWVPFNMYRGMHLYVTSAIGSNKSLMLYPKVAPIDAVIARFWLQALTSTVVAIVIIWGTASFDRYPLEVNWAPVLESTFLAWCFALGISLANIVLFVRFPIYEKVFEIASRPLFMISGVFYIPMSLPSPYRDFILDNPITQIIIIFREGFYKQIGSDGGDLAYLAWVSAITLFVGLLIFTAVPVGRQNQ